MFVFLLGYIRFNKAGLLMPYHLMDDFLLSIQQTLFGGVITDLCPMPMAACFFLPETKPMAWSCGSKMAQ